MSEQKKVEKKAEKKPAPAKPVKIAFLGGLNEVGKNMTLYEYKDDMFLVDCGLAFPDPEMLGVDLVIPENNWEQKVQDIKDYKIDVCVMGSDWAGSDKFDYLKEYCDVVFLERTPGVSTTQIKNDLQLQETVDGVDQVPRT